MRVMYYNMKYYIDFCGMNKFYTYILKEVIIH